MKIKSLIKSTVIAAAIVCLPFFSHSQSPDDGGGDPDPSEGMSAPLDLGIIVLAAAGVGYAAKRKYDARKKDGEIQNSI